MEFIYKNLCIYSYMFKLQSRSKYSLFDVIHLLRLFSIAQKFLNLLILMPFSAFAVFCFTASTSAKRFPLRSVFIQGNKQTIKVTWGKTG